VYKIKIGTTEHKIVKLTMSQLLNEVDSFTAFVRNNDSTRADLTIGQTIEIYKNNWLVLTGIIVDRNIRRGLIKLTGREVIWNLYDKVLEIDQGQTDKKYITWSGSAKTLLEKYIVTSPFTLEYNIDDATIGVTFVHKKHLDAIKEVANKLAADWKSEGYKVIFDNLGFKKPAYYTLDGTDDYISAPNVIDTRPFTIDMMIKLEAIPTSGTFIFDTRDEVFCLGGKGFLIQLSTSGTARVGIGSTLYSVVDETFNSNTLDTPVQLANTCLVSGTVVVTTTDGLTTFTEGTDYTIDYVNGTITCLSTGSMTANTDYLIDYDYYKFVWSSYSIDLSDLQLHKLQITVTSTTMNIYMDGTLIETVDISAVTEASLKVATSMMIGCRYNGTGYTNMRFDYIRVYNSELSTSDLQRNRDERYNPITDNLVLWYDAGWTKNTTIRDLSGNGNDGTVNGATQGLDEFPKYTIIFYDQDREKIINKIYVRRYQGDPIRRSETETFNSGTLDTWVDLPQMQAIYTNYKSDVQRETEVVTTTDGATTFVRGVDYEMDYDNGKIKCLSTGSMVANTDYKITWYTEDYVYDNTATSIREESYFAGRNEDEISTIWQYAMNLIESFKTAFEQLKVLIPHNIVEKYALRAGDIIKLQDSTFGLTATEYKIKGYKIESNKSAYLFDLTSYSDDVAKYLSDLERELRDVRATLATIEKLNEIKSGLVPRDDNTYTLGTAEKNWAEGYISQKLQLRYGGIYGVQYIEMVGSSHPLGKYRYPITIKNYDTTEYTNVQVKIVLDSSNFDFSLSTSDGRDIRLTDENDNELPFYIEKWDTATPAATIWVKIPTLPASPDGVTAGVVNIRLYCGYDSFTSKSNKSAVFNYYDNLLANSGFETGDLTSWDTTGLSSPYVSRVESLGYNPYAGNYALWILVQGDALLGDEGYISQTVSLSGEVFYEATCRIYRSWRKVVNGRDSKFEIYAQVDTTDVFRETITGDATWLEKILNIDTSAAPSSLTIKLGVKALSDSPEADDASIVTDPGFETWTSVTNLTYWSEVDIQQNTSYLHSASSTYSVQELLGGSSEVSQTVPNVLTKLIYERGVWSYAPSGAPQYYITVITEYSDGTSDSDTNLWSSGVWSDNTFVISANKEISRIKISNPNTDISIYIDDVHFYAQSPCAMFDEVKLSAYTRVATTTDPTVSVGTMEDLTTGVPTIQFKASPMKILNSTGSLVMDLEDDLSAKFYGNVDIVGGLTLGNTLQIGGNITVGGGLTANWKSKVYLSSGGAADHFVLEVGDSLGVWLQFKNIDRYWIIGINSAEEFHVEDKTAGTAPFKIKPAAPSDSLVIDSTGNLTVGGTLYTSGVLEIRRSDPNDFVKMVDTDTNDYFAWRITSTGDLCLDIYDSSAGVHRYPIYFYPSSGNVKISYNLTVGGNLTLGTATTNYIRLGSNLRIYSKNTEWMHVRNAGDTDYIGVAAKKLYVSGCYIIGSTSYFAPQNDATYDLGTSTNRWRNINLSGYGLFGGVIRVRGNRLSWSDSSAGNFQYALIQGKTADGYHYIIVPCDNAGTKTANVGYLGDSSYYWYRVTARTVYYKALSSFACALDLADLPVDSKFKTVQEAKDFLRREYTKQRYHMPYRKKCPKCGKEYHATHCDKCDCGEEPELGLRCICGKWVRHEEEICPEHRDQWEDKYCFRTSDVIEAVGIVLIDILDRLERLERKL